ncbi:MAG: tripartite tricarboxylate transporter TctB family protein [Hasllibacter sp.]
MRVSDRVFGLIVLLGSVAYFYAATQIRPGFGFDKMGPRAFPMGLGIAGALTGLVMVLRPDPEPGWPGPGALIQIAVATLVMLGFALALKEVGFLISGAVAAGILAWQIQPRPLAAVASGLALSVGLWLVFTYALGLNVPALPHALR